MLALLALFCIPATFFSNGYVFNEVFWYCTLYFLAAYIRLYARSWMSSKSKTGRFFAVSVLLGIASVLVMIAILKFGPLADNMEAHEKSLTYYWYWVHNSNKVLALLVGLSAFLWFKNLDLGYLPIVNTLSSTTLGILLIHAHSAAMSRFIWLDLLSATDVFKGPLATLALQAVLSPIIIYLVCTAIDLVRVRIIEKPVMRIIDQNEDRIKMVCSCIVGRLNIIISNII